MQRKNQPTDDSVRRIGHTPGERPFEQRLPGCDEPTAWTEDEQLQAGRVRGDEPWKDAARGPDSDRRGLRDPVHGVRASREPFGGEGSWHLRVGRPWLERAPKGYRRSDERIREDVCESLIDARLDVRDVEVTVGDGVVTLSGTVRDDDVRQAAEASAKSQRGVRSVENAIRVGAPSSRRLR